MTHKVAKFGGSSLADAKRVQVVLNIIRSDPSRTHIVVSAPGKRHENDIKVTDLFISWHHKSSKGEPVDKIRYTIQERFIEIVTGLKIEHDIAHELDIIAHKINQGVPKDYAASRGEYLMACVVAKALQNSGYEFVDAESLILFDEAGKKVTKIKAWLFEANRRCVIPGFYGIMPDGHVCTFPRGGSDITGAHIAEATRANVYENWTDVSGLCMADPRIIPDTSPLPEVTYRELREFARGGAHVFHPDALFPVHRASIPTHILNTLKPGDKGTHIVPDDWDSSVSHRITGVTGREGFVLITIKKWGMEFTTGYAHAVLGVLAKHDISIEHMPGGNDSITVIVDEKYVDRLSGIVREIQDTCIPDEISVEKDIALLAIVGRGMARTPGIAARFFSAIASAEINVRTIDQGASELSIVIGVKNEDLTTAICQVHSAFTS